MKNFILKTKEQQQIHSIFGGKFIENKPIPFPEYYKKNAYSNIFYWAHLEALETAAFPLHPHEGFEIMTFALKGSFEHYDSAIKTWKTIEEGGFQVIQAGSGVTHSEKIFKGSELFQIWFDPDFSKTLKTPASYQDIQSTRIEPKIIDGKKVYEYIGNSGILHQTNDIKISKEIYSSGRYNIDLDVNYIYSIYLISGSSTINNNSSKKDDFIICEDIKSLELDIQDSLELFIVKTPKVISYKTV